MSTQQRTMAVNCLACGAELNYDPTLGKLHCEYCDSEFTAEEIEAYYKDKEEQTASQGHSQSSSGGEEWSEDNMNAYSCSACGAEILADENTAATMCPYCGNNTISPAQFTGAVRPDYVIPFSFTKQQAEQKYQGYYKGRSLLPKSFAQNNHIEDIQGVYVPFWLYNGRASVQAQYEAYDEKNTSTERIKKYYECTRSGNVSFAKVPADASERMPDDLMDSIEPYKFEELKEFSMAYLPGFLAEKFNVSQANDEGRAKERIENTTKSLVRATVKHSHISRKQENVQVMMDQPEYGMLPVWYLVTKWNDKIFRFAMNGQTGKFIGDLPIDPVKMAIRVILWALIGGILLFLIFGGGEEYLYFLLGAVVAGVLGYITGYASMKPVGKAVDAQEYIKDDLVLTSSEDRYTRTVVEKKDRS